MDEGGGTTGVNSPTTETTTMKKTAFKRYTKRVLAKGDAEEADAWLLAYPLFSTSSSPTRELFDLWEKRYPPPTQLNPPPPQRVLHLRTSLSHQSRVFFYVLLTGRELSLSFVLGNAQRPGPLPDHHTGPVLWGISVILLRKRNQPSFGDPARPS
jgi:hypothetical protein